MRRHRHSNKKAGQCPAFLCTAPDCGVHRKEVNQSRGALVLDNRLISSMGHSPTWTMTSAVLNT